MTEWSTFTIAYTPNSNDAFSYFALETGRLPMPGFLPEFRREPIAALNKAAQSAHYEVTAISSAAYPQLADRYAILSVGASVGRGYGPVLVSRDFECVDDLRGRRVGVGDMSTTSWFLLTRLCPEALALPMSIDRIGEAVAAGELDGGVLIHEEMLYFPRLGLHRVMDLGTEWCRQTGLPLPVALNVARRDLGRPALERICSAIRRSLEHGLAHRQEALAWASRFGRGIVGGCTAQYVEMFANDDSLHMPEDVRDGLKELLRQAADMGLCETVPSLDIIEGTGSSSARTPRHF